jgi:hypothetical protein
MHHFGSPCKGYVGVPSVSFMFIEFEQQIYFFPIGEIYVDHVLSAEH